MKGFRPVTTLNGYSVGSGWIHKTRKGKKVATFVIAVGGNRDRGIKGVLFRCHGYGASVERVCKAVSEAGLAVSVSGNYYSARAVRDGNKVYVNNDLNIIKLAVQMKKEDEVLTKVEMKKYVERNAEVRSARGEGRTLKSIGEEFGISKERVRQILAMEVKDE